MRYFQFKIGQEKLKMKQLKISVRKLHPSVRGGPLIVIVNLLCWIFWYYEYILLCNVIYLGACKLIHVPKWIQHMPSCFVSVSKTAKFVIMRTNEQQPPKNLCFFCDCIFSLVHFRVVFAGYFWDSLEPCRTIQISLTFIYFIDMGHIWSIYNFRLAMVSRMYDNRLTIVWTIHDSRPTIVWILHVYDFRFTIIWNIYDSLADHCKIMYEILYD